MEKISVKSLLAQIKFLVLFEAFIGYAIGVGLYHHLGRNVDWFLMVTGAVIVALFLLSAMFMQGHSIQAKRKDFRYEENFTQKHFLLFSSFIVLIVASLLMTWLMIYGQISGVLFLFLGISVLLTLILAIPQLIGFEIILYVFYIAVLSPLFAYFLQAEKTHQTLLLISFPLVFLLISLSIAQNLKNTFEDQKNNRKTIVTQLGWEQAMRIHNLFIMLTYFTYGVSAIIGLPGNLGLLIYLSLPIAIIQFWEMTRIRNGEKPRWQIINLASYASVGLIAYLILYYLWIG